tara:strand:+ start:511 stop:1785 length:1275 start_codon:yes stop_codon:yes gene_type:complete
MKKIISFLICLPFIVTGQQLNFENSVTISDGTNGFGRPRIALTNDGPIIIWRKDSTPKVLKASKWNGSSFGQPYDICSSDVIPSSWDGPEIATKGDTVYVVFTSTATTQSSIMMLKSFDGGLSFSDTIRVSENNPSHKYRMGNIKIDYNGNPIVNYMQYLLNWTEPKQMVNRSINFGDSFLGGVEASQSAPGEPCDCCKASLVLDNDDIFLLFRNNNSNERNSYVSKSVDGGLTFNLVNDIDDYDWMVNGCPATGPLGVVYSDSLLIVRRSGATGNDEIVYNKINKVDLNYSYTRNIDPIIGKIQDYPDITLNGDTIFIAWQDNRNNIPDCFLSYSTSGVENLSLGIKFTDSLITGPKLNPDLVFKNNLIHLVYNNNGANSIEYIKGSFGQISAIEETTKQYKSDVKFDILGRKNKVPYNKLTF